MKNLFVILTLIASFAQTSFASESVESSVRTLVAGLVDFQVNQPWLGGVDQGSISIDLDNETMLLVLMENFDCPEGQYCIAMMNEYHEINVKLISTATDWCGATTYVGLLDQSPVDGLKETITVVDYSNMTCEMYVPFITQVSYETYNPWTEETLVSFFGGDLLRMKPVMLK